MLLVFVTAATYALLRDLNAGLRRADRERQTMEALATAKQALIAYAASYPDRVNGEFGPGYLPCPDRWTQADPLVDPNSKVGRAGTSCSDGGPSPTTIGRLPWRTLKLDYDSAIDGTGERLWYAVSESHRNNPKQEPLNSETPGMLTVDGVTDVVAVIIAPGPGLTGQDARTSDPQGAGYLAAGNYLEGENADLDRAFATNDAGAFNDQLLFITRDELMTAVEWRVLNEVARLLERYRDEHFAYPWLSAFADPKVHTTAVVGEAGAGSIGTTLVDANIEFEARGVQAGDLVRNVTDGSVGVVNSPPSGSTLTVDMLNGGADDSFQPGDLYVIVPGAAPARLAGTAAAGSAATVLVAEAPKDFESSGVRPGDIVENLSDGSSGVIASVADDRLTVWRLTGGAANVFAAGDAYRIRSDAGVAGPGSGGTVLTDATNGFPKDFVALGLVPGDVVYNLSSGTLGVVETVGVPDASTLTVAAVLGGTDIAVPGNVYVFSRFNAKEGVREGHLPLHARGEPFATAFSVDWSFLEGDGAVVTPPGPAAMPPAYRRFLREFVQSSAVSGPIDVGDERGACVWMDPATAECVGTGNVSFFEGTATAATLAAVLEDSERSDFAAGWGVERGDRIENLTDGSVGVIDEVGATTLSVVKMSGGANNAFAPGDRYAVRVASKVVRGQIWGVWGVNLLFSGPDLEAAGVEVGDYMVNENDGSIGVLADMQTVEILGIRFHLIRIDDVEGGTTNLVSAGDWIQFRQGFVYQRRYDFRFRFRGTVADESSAGQKLRDVCLGYDADCAGAPSDVQVPPHAQPAVTITDFDEDGNVVGTASVTIPAPGIPGHVRLAALRSELFEEVPRWFTANRWHTLVYAAYADPHKPPGGGGCVPGTDCLELEADAQPDDNKRALVLVAGGRELPTSTPQDRSLGRLADYYEAENAIASDDRFSRRAPGMPFNDRMRIGSLAP